MSAILPRVQFAQGVAENWPMFGLQPFINWIKLSAQYISLSTFSKEELNPRNATCNSYRQTSNTRRTDSQNLNVSRLALELSLSNPLNVLSRGWRCRWNSSDRRCSNYIWVINNILPIKVRLILKVSWYSPHDFYCTKTGQNFLPISPISITHYPIFYNWDCSCSICRESNDWRRHASPVAVNDKAGYDLQPCSNISMMAVVLKWGSRKNVALPPRMQFDTNALAFLSNSNILFVSFAVNGTWP